MALYALMDASGVWQNTTNWDGITPYAPAGLTPVLVSSLPPGGAQGYKLTVGTWTPSTITPVVPDTVTKAQFYAAAAGAGFITVAQAVALLANGTIPPNLAAAIATLPVSQQATAELAILGAPTYQRADAFVSMLGTAMGLTAAQLDTLFIAAGQVQI
jgi:hypothetical protein